MRDYNQLQLFSENLLDISYAYSGFIFSERVFNNKMQINIISVIYLSNIVSLLVVGVMLMVIKTTPELRKLKYHQAKRCLAIAVIIVAIGQIVQLLEGTVEETMGIFPFSILLVAPFQACLFTFLVLILFHSPYVTTKNIFKHLLPTIIFIVAYLAIRLICNDVKIYTITDYITHIHNPILLLRTAFVVTYGVQLIIYISLFNRERKLYIQHINSYFSDTSHFRLRWGTSLFYQAVAIGILALIFTIKPTRVGDILFTIFLPLFYAVFAVRYINFQYTLPTIIAAVEQNEMAQNNSTADNESKIEELCHELKMLLENDPIYLTQGIVIVDIATKLKVNKRLLSTCISSTYGKNFNSWINSLRVEHAKKLIDSCPMCSLLEIAEQSGFADAAMFSKEFKRHMGESPSVYRSKIRKG